MMIDCLLADYGGQRPSPAGNSDGPPRPPSFTSRFPGRRHSAACKAKLRFVSEEPDSSDGFMLIVQ